MRKTSNILLLCLCIICTSMRFSYAQSTKQIDTKLAKYMERVGYWPSHRDDVNSEDSLEKANNDLVGYIKKTFSKNKETLNDSFPQARKEGLGMLLSDDHKIRFFSWDTWQGGTMYYYNDIVQYQGNNHIIVRQLNTSGDDYGCDYMDLATIHTASGKSIYLVAYYFHGSNRDMVRGVLAYEIANDSLRDYPLFKTSKKLLTTIGYAYDFFESNNEKLTRTVPSVHWSDDLKKLYIPVVKDVPGTSGRITDKYLVYIFDGEHFVFDKNAH